MPEPFELEETRNMKQRLAGLAAWGREHARLAPESEIVRRGKRRRLRNWTSGVLLGMLVTGALFQAPTLLRDGGQRQGAAKQSPEPTVTSAPALSATSATPRPVTTTSRPRATTTTTTTTTTTVDGLTLSVRPSRITDGGSLTVRVGGCRPGAAVDLHLSDLDGPIPLGAARQDGTITKTIVYEFGPGRFRLMAFCGRYPESVDYTPSVGLTVLPKDGSPGWVNVQSDSYEYRPGRIVIVQGGLCPPGSMVTLRLDGERIGTVTAGSDGIFEARPRIPSDTPVGDYRITANCSGVQLPPSERLSVYRD
jgi:hypothetical protein